jgi:hypothetical protein
MEIIEDKSLLLVDMPIPSHPILEIKNKEIVKFIDEFFRNEKSFNHSIERGDAIHLLEILNECISKGKQSLTTFCQRCKDETKYDQLILNQLSHLLHVADLKDNASCLQKT